MRARIEPEDCYPGGRFKNGWLGEYQLCRRREGME